MNIVTSDLNISDVNFGALHEELEGAGLPVWTTASVTRQPFEVQFQFPAGTDRTALLAVINAHDAGQLSTEQTIARQAAVVETGASDEARAIPDFVGWTPAEAQAWVQANVTDLLTAKVALTKLAGMAAALNARVFPNIRAERQLSGE